MTYRNDMDALLERSESLERDLERARAELAELRGQPPRRTRRDSSRDLNGVLTDGAVPPIPLAPAPPRVTPAAERHVLDELERHHPVEPTGIRDLGGFEDELVRAMELTLPEMKARHRGVAGDGTHAQLVALLHLLIAVWSEYTSGSLPARGERSWRAVEQTTRGWAPHNELGRVLAALGDYYLTRL